MTKRVNVLVLAGCFCTAASMGTAQINLNKVKDAASNLVFNN